MSTPGTDSKKRRPEPQYYPPGPRLVPEPGPPVGAPKDRGHVRLVRILDRLARIFPQCAPVWMILHIVAETIAAGWLRPEYTDIDNEGQRERLGIADLRTGHCGRPSRRSGGNSANSGPTSRTRSALGAARSTRSTYSGRRYGPDYWW